MARFAMDYLLRAGAYDGVRSLRQQCEKQDCGPAFQSFTAVPKMDVLKREETMKTRYVLSALAAMAMTGAVQAQTSVKLGVLNDRSGIYSDLTGEGSVIEARMAAEDFKASEKGIKVDIVGADHQNKPAIGASIARQWDDQDGVTGAPE